MIGDRGLGRVIQMYLSDIDTKYDDLVSYVNSFLKESTMEKAFCNLDKVKHLWTSVKVLALSP